MSTICYDPYNPESHYYPAPKYTVGLDLGQARDFTALCILEREGEGDEAIFLARHLQRFALGTTYPAIVASVAKMLRQEPLAIVQREAQPQLAIDQTGVGAPVVEMFERAPLNARLYPIHSTGGASVNYDRGVEYVPRRVLVSVVQVALQTDKLKIAGTLPEAQTLVREMQGFQVKVTEAADDTYGAWREGSHDDLVLAVALALWVGKKKGDHMEPHSFSFRTYW